ncbi:hypothetical protein K505DRAFT_340475 [Melanomma pulvis-pyrius CBS 109.77]|uniref:Uncharacterized protein n=1 Tax=Melanomma pulvis-pyrius CBS 109.77 TaxID=1314802 RepID=A0A6A6X2E2_9PLEO|nr:hypothetical protein K505DRAFT_340475 [Melanomma pulvis-pyrius CBS 109.77]
MLSKAKRRGPPSPIHIPKLRLREDAEGDEERRQTPTPTIPTPPPTSPLRTANPAFGPFPKTTTTLPAQAATSTKISLPTVASVTSTFLATKPTMTAPNSQSPTRTTFITVTQTQSIVSPKEKGEQSPGIGTKTIFISGAPQIITVTVGGTQGSSTSLSNTSAGATGGTNLLPRGAMAPLIALGVIAGLSAIITVTTILWRRKKKKADNKAKGLQRPVSEVGDDGFRAIPDTRPIMS